jgi:hypothetical protein
MVLYHGTPSREAITEFQIPNDGEREGSVIWLTPSKSYAASYGARNFVPDESGIAVGKNKAHVIPVYARSENPFDLENKEQYAKYKREQEKSGTLSVIDYAKQNGYDSVRFNKSEWGFFKPEQIKSAIGNSGAFDPSDPNILRNREKPQSDIEHWTDYAKNMSFDTEQEARDWTFRKKQQSDEQYGYLFGKAGPEKNRAFADSLHIRKEGKKFKIGAKVKEPVSKERLGAEEPEGNSPAVDWSGQDLQDSGKSVDEESILKDYGSGKPGKVYRAYVDPSILEPKLAEEDDEDEDSATYDWDELDRSRGRAPVPPAKILVRANGKVEIIDGNHRIKYWQNHGFDSIPAWVIDRRNGIKMEPKDGDTAFNRENPTIEGGRGQSPELADEDSTGTVLPVEKDEEAPARTTTIPVQGGTVLASAPKQEPVVPVVRMHVLPFSEVKTLAAGLNPSSKKEAPKPQVKSVRELMAEAKERMSTQMVP